MWDLWVKLYLGENEDSSQGGSISDTSEKMLQRGRGRYMEHIFAEVFWCSLVRFTASHEDQTSPWNILVLF